MTGKVFAAALAMLVAFGCSDPPTTSTSLNETTPVVELGAGAVQMVPFKGHGHWWTVGHTVGCEGDPGNAAAHAGGKMNLTHLGFSEYTSTNCWALDPQAPLGGWFLSQTGTATAANGDQLSWYGSAAMGSIIAIDFATLTYEMGPFWFTGGTGRFDGATGSFTTWGVLAADLSTGKGKWGGVVSSVGSIK